MGWLKIETKARNEAFSHHLYIHLRELSRIDATDICWTCDCYGLEFELVSY